MADKKVRVYLDESWRTLLDDRDKIDEDNMASDSDAHVPTQQSVKAYVDNNTINEATAIVWAIVFGG